MYRCIYTDRAGRRSAIGFTVSDISPRGADCGIVALVGDDTLRIAAKHMADLVDLETGEIIADPVEHFRCAFLDARRRPDGKIPLASVIDALPVDNIGQGIALTLAARFVTWAAFHRAVFVDRDRSAIQMAAGVGGAIADLLLAMAADERMVSAVDRLLAGRAIADHWDITGPLAGTRIVLTGTLESMTRAEATAAVLAAGGTVAATVNDDVDFVVAGADPGAKLRRAGQLGIEVIGEAGFHRLLAGDKE